MDWTSPDDIRAEVQKAWDRGRILAARLGGEPLFPMTVRSHRPDSRALLDRFDEVRAWVRALENGSRATLGYGYDVVWAELDHRQLGRNRVPERIVVPTEADAIQLLGVRRPADRFDRLARRTLAEFPELRAWLIKKPHEVLAHAATWDRLLSVVSWLRAHPRPAVYVRTVDLPGVDTKLIEEHRKLLTELLDQVLPPAAVDRTASQFEVRYGFRAKSPCIRFRILDDRHAIGGLTDLSVPVHQLAAYAPTAARVFITENELNGLSFPEIDDAVVIFGLGYGVESLAALPWLAERPIHYWGDLDTHGFVMLDRLRASFPSARSLLMDRETLLAHRASWVREPRQNTGPVPHLTQAEAALFDDLLHDRLGEKVRLEQERIGYGSLQRALSTL
ncbi:MAG: hypothetical protein HYV09_20620 [Deltaproteobacteria bacterium]|nr:hypothetical protein [Deltaproteobacteria bacterium]